MVGGFVENVFLLLYGRISVQKDSVFVLSDRPKTGEP